MDNCQTYNIAYEDLPESIPVFPLSGVLLLPHGQLPLNIFEPRYRAMIDDALKTDRLIGIIQPAEQGNGLQSIGCAGKIVHFSEHCDGRYTVTLHGLWRFKVQEEQKPVNGYRRIKAKWDKFADDVLASDCLNIDRAKLNELMNVYLEQNNLSVDCSKLEKASDSKLITALSMICPFDPLDKQALLEAACCKTRAEMFMVMLEIAIHENRSSASLH